MNRLLALITLTFALPNLAAADPHDHFKNHRGFVGHSHQAHGFQASPYGPTTEIRLQLEVVKLQARESLRRCDERDDVFDEIEDLCRRLDFFDDTLRRAAYSHQARRHLGRLAERVDDQACELLEEIDDALEDLRDDRRHASFGPRVIPAHAYYAAQPSIRFGSVTFTFGSPRARIYSAGYPAAVPYHSPLGCALRSEAQQLRQLTLQLRRAFCH